MIGGAHGEPNKFRSIDPLLWRVGLVALIVAAGVALTADLLLRLTPAVVTESGLWNIPAVVRHMSTALVRYL